MAAVAGTVIPVLRASPWPEHINCTRATAAILFKLARLLNLDSRVTASARA